MNSETLEGGLIDLEAELIDVWDYSMEEDSDVKYQKILQVVRELGNDQGFSVHDLESRIHEGEVHEWVDEDVEVVFGVCRYVNIDVVNKLDRYEVQVQTWIS